MPLAIGWMLSLSPGFGKPEYTRKEKKSCATCHTNAGQSPKELTETGKCYGEKKDLKECVK